MIQELNRSTSAAAHRSSPERIPILGMHVSAATFDEACDILASAVSRREPSYVSCANVYSIMLAHDDPEYRRIVNDAFFVTADGMPIVWALRALGRHAERVHNDDLFLACCSRFPEWRHFLVGGREGQPEEAAAEMGRRFPGIRVVGTAATPVRPVPADRTGQIVESIRIARPDIVWVGMGTPAQDQWMVSAVAEVGGPMVGVGSLFDLLTGRTKPTPAWMKRTGLQWFYRLLQEPRRLGFRYLYYNPRFVIALAGELLRSVVRRQS